MRINLVCGFIMKVSEDEMKPDQTEEIVGAG